MWCPSSLAKLLCKSNVTRVYGGRKSIVRGDYKPTYKWRGTTLWNNSDEWPLIMKIMKVIRMQPTCKLDPFFLHLHHSMA